LINFEGMHELHAPHGYLIAATLATYLHFKKKNWL
jgi:hypothetical protein